MLPRHLQNRGHTLCPQSSSARSAPSRTRPSCSVKRSTGPSPSTAWTGAGTVTTTSRCSTAAAVENRVAAYAESVGATVDAAAIHETKSRVFRENLAGAQVEPRPGVVGTVRGAKDAGAKVGLVTTTSPDNIAALLNALGPDVGPDSFDVIISSADVEHPKPDAAAYVTAVRRLGEEPARCVAIEDNVEGAQAAAAAGVPCVAFPNAEHRRPRLRRRRAPGRRLSFADLSSPPRLTESWRRTTMTVTPRANVPPPRTAFHVEAYEKIDYSLLYVDGAFARREPRDRRQLPAVRALPDGGRRDRLRPLRRADARLLRPSRDRADGVPRDDPGARQDARHAWSGSSTPSPRSGCSGPSPCWSSAAA